MPTPTTHAGPAPGTFQAVLDLGNTTWCLACAQAEAAPARLRVLPARDLTRLHHGLATARQHVGAPSDGVGKAARDAARAGQTINSALVCCNASYAAAQAVRRTGARLEALGPECDGMTERFGHQTSFPSRHKMINRATSRCRLTSSTTKA